MNKKVKQKQLIITGVMIALAIAVSAVIAFNYYRSPSTAVVKEKTVQHEPGDGAAFAAVL